MAKDALSLRVRLRYMNECRIFHNFNSITFLLYTFSFNLLDSSMFSIYEIKINNRYVSRKIALNLKLHCAIWCFHTS